MNIYFDCPYDEEIKRLKNLIKLYKEFIVDIDNISAKSCLRVFKDDSELHILLTPAKIESIINNEIQDIESRLNYLRQKKKHDNCRFNER